MTAFSRLASFSVWVSSVSSLLGKVVMRTNSVAAKAGRALATNWRTSDTLRWRKVEQVSHEEDLYAIVFKAHSYNVLPMGVVEFLHQPASIGQSDLDAGDGLRAVHTDGSTSLSFTTSLVLWVALERHQFWSGAEEGKCRMRTIKFNHIKLYNT